jgi:hypothetical protein
MSISESQLRQLIRKLVGEVLKELDEASVTGNVPGYNTPNAFTKKSDVKKKKKHMADLIGFTLAEAAKTKKFLLVVPKNIYGGVRAVFDSKAAAQRYMEDNIPSEAWKHVSIKPTMLPVVHPAESVTEGKYHDYRNDESLSPKQKIGQSIREIRDRLNELDKSIKMNVRLKNELGVDSRQYWKRTKGALTKISERLVKMAKRVGEMY